jgi:oligoendopeptidase F
MRAMKPYQLSDELEKFLHDQSVVGAAAWNKLFDETMAGLSLDPEGEGDAAGGHAEPADRSTTGRGARRRRARWRGCSATT